MGLRLEMPEELGPGGIDRSPTDRPTQEGGLGWLRRRGTAVKFDRWVETWAL